ncbi:MAG TPA: biotin/lipoyl-binding protein, partial [Bacillota bacterium]|nr:biotin/lipoyl-binding protein [Bacillota bacterium]
MNLTTTGTTRLEPAALQGHLETPAPKPLRNQPGSSQTETHSASLPDTDDLLTEGTGTTPDDSLGSRHRPLFLGLAGLAALVVALYGSYRWWDHARTWVKTDNAYVATHIHTISARVAGTVKEVLIAENQSVDADNVLARLDPRDFEVRRQQALAQVAQAGAQLQQAEAQMAQARAQIAREQARATKAKQDLERANSLYKGAGGAISKQEFDQAQAESTATQAALQGAESALESARALIIAAQAQEKVAQANLQEAELQLSYTEILAPATGRIGRKNLETGNRVQPGQALLALVQPEVWITANFKE